MKKSLLALLAFGALAVQADPIVIQDPQITHYTDIVDPNPDVRLSVWGNQYYTFTHNLVDDGFTPGQQKVYSAVLAVTLQDDGNDDMVTDGLEKIWIRIDGSTLVNNTEVNTGTYSFNVESRFLESDGKLVVKLMAKDGDFYFRRSELDVDASVIPEPTTIALTGLGLLGLGFYTRRRKQ